MSNLLKEHEEAKQSIVDALQKLAACADNVGMNTLAAEIKTARIPKLKGERFHLVILGEFNHGKSTFVNALLGDSLLPVGITPTTATINHVVYSKTPSMRAVLQDGKEEPLEVGQLANWVTAAGDKAQDVSYVEVGYPADLLKANITLVDTPGVNDMNEQRAEVTYGYVPRADAVLFLLDAAQALKDSEREFLSSHVFEGSRDRMIFVLGKVDLLSDEEKDAVIEYVRGGLAKIAPEPKLFPLSAKKFLEKKADSGVEEFLSYLTDFLDTDRARVVIDNASVDAVRTAAYLRENIGVRLQSFAIDVGELEQRVESVRAQLDTSKRTLDDLYKRIEVESAAIKNQVSLDLDQFVKTFSESLPEQLDGIDAEDIKTYLGPFVEDMFRQWSQLEGDKLGRLLESLAEDVIAVTNENVEAAGDALASRLGPTDARVQIDVNSFKYDVGVYALGALGTTLFLFVNTLAGGLLTLAAPVLAIVVKSKVAGDIREQAKERAPAAIVKAGKVMQPHFDSCIDDFCERLKDFVLSAGNTLFKGISEILDQTIDERQKASTDVAKLREQAEKQAAEVDLIREQMERLRIAAWKDA